MRRLLLSFAARRAAARAAGGAGDGSESEDDSDAAAGFGMRQVGAAGAAGFLACCWLPVCLPAAWHASTRPAP